jgi:predicted GNAT superfamily acetyltransferase
MPVPIRDVESGDIDRIRSLNDDAVPTVNALSNADLDWFADHAHYFRVVIDPHDADQPAAFLIGLRPGLEYASENYRWFCRNYRDFAYVDRVVVDPQFRRSGFASLLYRDFQRSLPAELAVMTCEVNLEPPNPASLRFHERLGFRRVGSQETDGGAKCVALMEKRL